MPPAPVRAFTLVWIKSGALDIQVDLATVRMANRQLASFSPGQVIAASLKGNQPEGYAVQFDPDFYCIQTHDEELSCNGLLFHNYAAASILQLTAPQCEGFRRVFLEMREELEHPGSALQTELLRNLLKQLVIKATRIFKAQHQAGLPDTAHHLRRRFLGLVEQHFRETRSVADYAAWLHVSPAGLTKALARAGDPPPTAIIAGRVLLEAKRRLAFSGESVKEVAFFAGFDDPHYFSRFFAKHTGMSPVEYRDRYFKLLETVQG